MGTSGEGGGGGGFRLGGGGGGGAVAGAVASAPDADGWNGDGDRGTHPVGKDGLTSIAEWRLDSAGGRGAVEPLVVHDDSVVPLG